MLRRNMASWKPEKNDIDCFRLKDAQTTCDFLSEKFEGGTSSETQNKNAALLGACRVHYELFQRL